MSNLEPVKIEILLRETIAKGLEEAIAAVKGLDIGVKQSSVNMKEQIAQQRQLIREITGDIKNLTAAAKEATDPGKKAEILGDLKGARRALAEEQATMIGLQRQQIEGNGKEAASHGGIIAGLGKWVLGLASVAAALEVGKKIIESTESTAHAFEQTIAAVSSATNYLFQTIASGDWSNFTDGMATAVNGAIEYVNAMEEVNNLTNQDKIESAEFDKKIAAAREKTYDKGKGNNEDRLKGYDEWIAASEEKYTGLIETAQKKYNALITKASTDTGGKTSVEEIDTFISKYRSVKEMIEEGERYNKLKSIKLVAPMAGGFSPTMGNAAEFDKAQAQMREMGEEGRKAAEKAFNISKIIFPVRDAIAEAKAKLISLDAQKDLGPTLAKRSKGSLENKIENDAIAAAKKLKEAEGLENRIKAVRDLMDETKDANSAEFAALAKKLVMLEAEKKLRQSMVDMQMMIAKNQPITSKGATSSTSAIYEMAKAGGIDLEHLKLKDTDIEINKLKKGNDARDAEANKLRKKYHLEEKKEIKDITNSYYEAADAASALAQAIGSSNPGLAEMLTGVSKIANQIGNLKKAGAFTKGGMSKGDAISATISGATDLIGIVAGAAAERKRVMDEYYASIISQQQQYNLLLNDQLRINSDVHGSIFLKDYEGSLKDSTAAYNDAQSKYQEELKKFSTAEAITGKKNVVSGGNVLGGIGAGAAAGAGIGAILGGGVLSIPAAAAGAIIGSVVGALTGLFAKKKKDIVAPLLETYPDLIKANGEFNADLAKTLIANNKVTDATKVTLQNLIDWKDAAAKATEQLKSVITDLTGSLGDDLRNALVTAFKDGTDASVAFGDSVNKVLENILSNMIFNKVFAGAFAQLEKGMTDSYATGGDGNWQDDLKVFFDQRGALTDQFNKALTDAKQAGAADGFDIFGKDTSAASATGMKGDIQRMSEEAGSALTGNVSAIRINMARLIESGTTSMTMLQKSLEYQLRTADNTGEMNKTLTDMNNRLTRFELDGLKVK